MSPDVSPLAGLSALETLYLNGLAELRDISPLANMLNLSVSAVKKKICSRLRMCCLLGLQEYCFVFARRCILVLK